MQVIPKLPLLFCLLLLCVNSCIKDTAIHQSVWGNKGIYLSQDSLLHFSQEPPHGFGNTGKISFYRDFLFIVDHNQGIHIIDVKDTSQSTIIYFLNIPGVQDITIQNQTLYADNGPHLLVLDITIIHQVQIIKRVLHIFEQISVHPEPWSGWFECIIPEKGWLIGWERALLMDPKCSI